MKFFVIALVAVMGLGSRAANAYWWEIPTYKDMVTAPDRLDRDYDLPKLRRVAEKDIKKFIDNPKNYQYLVVKVQNHNEMGEPVIKTYIVTADLIKQMIDNPIVDLDLEKADLSTQAVYEKMRRNEKLFGTEEVSTVFTPEEHNRIVDFFKKNVKGFKGLDLLIIYSNLGTNMAGD